MTLRVKLEIVPFGMEDRAHEIARLDIGNRGPDMMEEGYHRYVVLDLTKGQEGMYRRDIKHRRKDGPWDLVNAVITNLNVRIEK